MAAKDERGRLSSLNADVQKTICQAVADGSPLKFAAEAAGVSERSVTRWLASGRKRENEDCVAFLSAVKKAEAECVKRNVKKIISDKSWQSRAWWLERRFPDYFGSDARLVRELKVMILELTKGSHAGRLALPPATKKTGHGRAIDPGPDE